MNSDSESLDSQINDLNDVFQNDMVFNDDKIVNCKLNTDDEQLDDNQLDVSNDFSLDDKLINDQIVNRSLMDRNLEYLSSGFSAFSGRSVNPISVFFDQLQHPDADLGDIKPSALKWAYNSKNKIDHLVIGKGLPGGK